MSSNLPEYFDQLNREYGDGSRSEQSDWHDDNNRISRDLYTSARTTFWPSDVDDTATYEQLLDTHKRFSDGEFAEDRKTSIRYGHIVNDINSFCNYCELSRNQTEAVVNIIKTTNISSNNYGGRSYETIILAVMSLVVDRDIENPQNLGERLILNDEFKQLLDAVGIGSTELRRTREQVRERVDLERDADTYRPVN